MNDKRIWSCWVTAIAFAWFAMSASAAPPLKQYTLQFQTFPNFDTNGQVMPPVSSTVTVRNAAPPGTGSSNISSFSFSLYGLTILHNPTHPLSCPGASCALDPVTNTVSVTNLSPIQAGQTYTVGFHVSSCGDGTITNPEVYTGSQLSGQKFQPFGGLPGFPPILAQSVLCGDIACGESFIVPDGTNPPSTSPKFLAGVRGSLNTDGACAAVNNVSYFATNTIAVDQTLHFRWHVGQEPDSEPNAAFLLTFNTGSTQTPNPQFAWLTDGSGNPQFIAAQSCLQYAQAPQPANKLPARLASLTADVSATDKMIKVDTTTASVAVPAPPFAITIVDANDATKKERLLVTKIGGSNWTVTRGHGKTTPASHTTGQSVIITYMPLMPNNVGAPYEGGASAQMCLQEAGTYTDDSTWFFRYIDSGDGWASNN